MYVQGVPTRKVVSITERLCGRGIYTTKVSWTAILLDDVLEAWHARPLGPIIYLYLDARYEKVQNASQYVPRQSMKQEVAADIRAIFNAPDREQVEVQLRKTVEKYAKRASILADWLEGNIPEGLMVFAFPTDHRRRIRTVNSLE